jgi:4-diphosphocytidyl-2-C-methyl-D-erythritol kinase
MIEPVLAPAKINLYLHVVGKRPDGYHLLESLVVFAAMGDRIAVAPADELSLKIDGPFAGKLAADADNLVLRAAGGLRTLAGVKAGAAITLTKNLPIASGIGGGSADAAATIGALLTLWGVRPDRDQVFDFALTLGADVPVCFYGAPAVMTGVGEAIKPAGLLPPMHVLLVNPLVATPTPQVFKARTGPFSGANPWEPLLPIPAPTPQDLAAALKARRNDLTEAAIGIAPVIRDVLTAIERTDGCLLARLSGSGATCFGLYAQAADAEAARQAVLAAQPGWWAVATEVAS